VFCAAEPADLHVLRRAIDAYIDRFIVVCSATMILVRLVTGGGLCVGVSKAALGAAGARVGYEVRLMIAPAPAP